MPDGDVYEINVDGTLDSQNICNVHHFVQVGSDGTGDARAALAVLWNDKFKAKFLDCLSDQYDQTTYRVRQLQPVETQSLVTTAVGQGQVASEPIPTQSCAILRQHAIPSGRKGTGHVKLSGISITHYQEGRITEALQTLLEIFGAVMESNQTESGSGFVFRSGVYSIADSVLRTVVKAVAVGAIKTVYSRQIGVGS